MTDDVTIDLRAHARAIIDATEYLVLGSVGSDGRPWTSPVYFAPGGDRVFYWVSSVDARHSVNLAADQRASLTVFDSTVLPYHGRALYAEGAARALERSELEAALEHYPRADSVGVTSFGAEDVTGPSPYRLYAFAATDLCVLCPREPREPCPLHGLATDHRTPVPAE